MTRAYNIVYTLLETGPDDINPDQYVDAVYQDIKNGKINSFTALTANEFWHRRLKYADGKTSIRARRNGRTKTWKRQPGKFRIPVKYGFYEYFYIDNNNADEWSTVPL